MRGNSRRYVFFLAMLLVIGPGMAWAGPPASAQDRGQTYNGARDQDYSKNKNYQQGVRDGQNDRMHNRDHSKKRHFKKDEDQKAYEQGYQKGREK